jgi:hypothetical protein
MLATVLFFPWVPCEEKSNEINSRQANTVPSVNPIPPPRLSLLVSRRVRLAGFFVGVELALLPPHNVKVIFQGIFVCNGALNILQNQLAKHKAQKHTVNV